MAQEELLFRVAVAVLAILMKLIRWPTRHLTGWNATWPLMKRYPLDGAILSLCGVLWVSAIVAYVLFAQHLTPWHVDFPTWARLLGIILGLSAAGLTRWADYSLGRNLSVIVHVTDQHTLVIRGPYRWIRHPIYAGAVLFAAGLFLTSANWLIGLCGVIAASLLCGTRIRREERLMIRQFGDAYRLYMQHTGRLLPRLPGRRRFSINRGTNV